MSALCSKVFSGRSCICEMIDPNTCLQGNSGVGGGGGGGVGRESETENMSVSSSQHSSSQEGDPSLMTPHRKFASNIATLDKRDRELVYIAEPHQYICLKGMLHYIRAEYGTKQ